LRGGIIIRIDSHQHFWKLSRGDYGWLKSDVNVLYRDYLPENLQPILEEHQIDKTIVVQAAPTVEETEFLLDLHKQYDFIAGVVGWLDFESPSFKENFDRLRQEEGFIGVRPMLQDLTDDNWVLRPEVMKNIDYLVSNDFPLDVLIYPRHLTVILELLQEFPQLRAVINHGAKPDIQKGPTFDWKSNMQKLASYPNVMCKLSGLVTEVDHNDWHYNDFVPFVQYLVEVFGTDKVMFGSDWPVCRLAGSYDDVWEILRKSLPQDLTSDDLKQVFGGNAARFYKLNIK
jgi:L-fuconolactonase